MASAHTLCELRKSSNEVENAEEHECRWPAHTYLASQFIQGTLAFVAPDDVRSSKKQHP